MQMVTVVPGQGGRSQSVFPLSAPHPTELHLVIAEAPADPTGALGPGRLWTCPEAEQGPLGLPGTEGLSSPVSGRQDSSLLDLS